MKRAIWIAVIISLFAIWISAGTALAQTGAVPAAPTASQTVKIDGEVYNIGTRKATYLFRYDGTVLMNHPKPRFLFGPSGGYDFGNTFVGGVAAAELPFGRHFESDSSVEVYPYESHVKLGRGVSYTVESGAIVWANYTSGFEGMYSHGGYSVTKAVKSADYVYAGYVYKHTMVGAPTRFHFDFFEQVHNGISANGTETNHVIGGAFTFDSMIGCTKHTCARSSFTWYTGRTLNQGNPYCDGTFSGCPNILPRQSVVSGGFKWTLLFAVPAYPSSEVMF